MSPKEFVNALKVISIKLSSEEIISDLKNPSEKLASIRLKEISSWYNALPADNQAMIDEVINMATASSLYGVLSVFDGMLSIEQIGPKGNLEIYFLKDAEKLLLNDPANEPLTNLFKEN